MDHWWMVAGVMAPRRLFWTVVIIGFLWFAWYL